MLHCFASQRLIVLYLSLLALLNPLGHNFTKLVSRSDCAQRSHQLTFGNLPEMYVAKVALLCKYCGRLLIRLRCPFTTAERLSPHHLLSFHVYITTARPSLTWISSISAHMFAPQAASSFLEKTSLQSFLGLRNPKSSSPQYPALSPWSLLCYHSSPPLEFSFHSAQCPPSSAVFRVVIINNEPPDDHVHAGLSVLDDEAC